MRRFALIALALLSAVVPKAAHARPVAVGELYVRAAGTPGEPPPAVLVLTGVAGIAFVARRKSATRIQ